MDNILTVGKKNGEMDFSIAATIADLNLKQMTEFRTMIVVAIGTAEEMWRRNRNDNVAASQDGKIYSW